MHLYRGILLSHKKEWNNVIWSNMMGLEVIILSKVSQTNILWYHLHVEFKKKWRKWTYLQNRNRLTNIDNELINNLLLLIIINL